MRAQARHQLKEDKFSKTTIRVAENTVHWTQEHQSKLILAAGILVVVVAAVIGGWYYLNRQDQQASLGLSQALRTLDTPIRLPVRPPRRKYPVLPPLRSVRLRPENNCRRSLASTLIPVLPIWPDIS